MTERFSNGTEEVARLKDMVEFYCNQVDEAKAEIATLIQTSGELCSVCGWRFVIPGDGCYYCHYYALKVEIAELKEMDLKRLHIRDHPEATWEQFRAWLQTADGQEYLRLMG